jgi:hypothetical protein
MIKFWIMKTKDFICICLGLYDSTCKKIDDICDDFDVDFSTDEFNEWISWRGQSPDIQLGYLIISDLYRKVIQNAMDDFGEWLDEEKFDYDANDLASHLYYDSGVITDSDDIERIVERIQEMEEEEEDEELSPMF